MKKGYYIFTIAILIFVACDKYIEDDISKQEVYILSPPNNFLTYEQDLVIWWDYLDEANYYHLQIVSYSFDSIIRLIVDSTLTTNRYEHTFSSGRYELRVKAKNGNSETPYLYRKFSIDTSLIITYIQPELLTPSEAEYLNYDSITFVWNKIKNAEKYFFELQREDVNVIAPIQTFENELNISDFISEDLSDGEYTWKVYAMNIHSISRSSQLSFILDKTPPENPELQLPNNKDTIDDSNVNLSWTRGSDNFDVKIDSIFLYLIDSTENIKTILLKNASELSNTNFNILKNQSWYYWTVVSYDLAGNKSASNEEGYFFYFK